MYATVDLSKKKRRVLNADIQYNFSRELNGDGDIYAAEKTEMPQELDIINVDPDSNSHHKTNDEKESSSQTPNINKYFQGMHIQGTCARNGCSLFALLLFVVLLINGISFVSTIVLLHKVDTFECSPIVDSGIRKITDQLIGHISKLEQNFSNLSETIGELHQCQCNRTSNISELKGLSFEWEQFITNYLNNKRMIPSSCDDILSHNSSSSSGYYLVRSSTGQLVSVYCDMTRICGNITGGWMRIAKLDLDYCFTELRSKIFNGTRTCVVENDDPDCTLVQFSSFNIQYSRVCGKVRGYGIGTVDGLYYGSTFRGNAVTDNYLDGVSISSNGSHIWSFIAGNCGDCDTPSFIGNDWTCDQCEDGMTPCHKLLWNSSECGEEGIFLKLLSNPTSAGLTLKVCRNEARQNEDIAISVVELYVY